MVIAGEKIVRSLNSLNELQHKRFDNIFLLLSQFWEETRVRLDVVSSRNLGEYKLEIANHRKIHGLHFCGIIARRITINDSCIDFTQIIICFDE